MAPGPKKTTPSLLRSEYHRYIEEHQFLPDHIKPELKSIVSTHFKLMSELLGTMELLYRRENE